MRLALLSMEQKINDRGLDVEAEIPEDSVLVIGERDLITQVIYNLLENAAKFASPNTALYLGLQTGEEQVVVSVRNHGATIPPEESNVVQTLVNSPFVEFVNIYFHFHLIEKEFASFTQLFFFSPIVIRIVYGAYDRCPIECIRIGTLWNLSEAWHAEAYQECK